jgi:hypothetical protein
VLAFLSSVRPARNRGEWDGKKKTQHTDGRTDPRFPLLKLLIRQRSSPFLFKNTKNKTKKLRQKQKHSFLFGADAPLPSY